MTTRATKALVDPNEVESVEIWARIGEKLDSKDLQALWNAWAHQKKVVMHLRYRLQRSYDLEAALRAFAAPARVCASDQTSTSHVYSDSVELGGTNCLIHFNVDDDGKHTFEFETRYAVAGGVTECVQEDHLRFLDLRVINTKAGQDLHSIAFAAPLAAGGGEGSNCVLKASYPMQILIRCDDAMGCINYDVYEYQPSANATAMPASTASKFFKSRVLRMRMCLSKLVGARVHCLPVAERAGGLALACLCLEFRSPPAPDAFAERTVWSGDEHDKVFKCIADWTPHKLASRASRHYISGSMEEITQLTVHLCVMSRTCADLLRDLDNPHMDLVHNTLLPPLSNDLSFAAARPFMVEVVVDEQRDRGGGAAAATIGGAAVGSAGSGGSAAAASDGEGGTGVGEGSEVVVRGGGGAVAAGASTATTALLQAQVHM